MPRIHGTAANRTAPGLWHVKGGTMYELIKLWQRRSDKYQDLSKKCDDEIRQEGLLAQSHAYDICADELRRELNKPELNKEG